MGTGLALVQSMKHATTISKDLFLAIAIALGLALAVVSTSACGGPVEVAACDADLDSDFDGLDDCVEAELGTSPKNADTDGDGISDYDEVIEYGYSAESNNDEFYPLIPAI